MTYRELIELYKAGELELEQQKKIEQDIERQEAIGDYLYEKEEIPELGDVFTEKDDDIRSHPRGNVQPWKITINP